MFDVVFFAPLAGPRFTPGPARATGGAETQIAMIARQLARAGRRVGVVTFDVPGLPDVVDGVHILRIRRRPGSPRLVRAARVLRALAGARAPVLVQRAAGAETGVAALVARMAGRRFVYSTASVTDFSYAQRHPERARRWLFHLGVRLASQIVVQTEEQVGLCQQGFRRRPVLIKSMAEAAEPAGAEQDAFLWVGRVAPYKRPEDFVRLAEALPNARFRIVVAGDGDELRADLRERALGLGNVEWLEPRPRPELLALMRSAVAVVNTSNFEGMPNVFLEGWARGVPALSLRQDPGGVIVRHRLGEFAGGDFDRFVDAARTMWEARGDAGELAERCRAYVATEHDPDVVVRQWIDMLEL